MRKNNFLTTNLVAEKLGVSKIHARRLIRSRKIRGEKVGNDWLVHPLELERYISKQLIKQKEIVENGNDK